MRKSIVLQAVAAVSLALSAATTTAAEFRGFYAGVGAGSASVEDDFSGFDDSDTGFKVFGGYSLGEFLAVELAYMDGGTAEETRSIFDSPFVFLPFNLFLVSPNTTVTTEVETKIINLSVLGNLPLTESFALFGKLGYASIDVDVDARVNLTGTPLRASSSDTSEEVSYAAGAVYSFGDFFQVRAEYEGFDVSNGNLDFISLSGVYRFR